MMRRMTTRLTRSQDGLALPLTDALLKQLGYDESTPLELGAHGRVLTVSPSRVAPTAPSFKESAERVHKKHGEVFRRLSKL